MRRFIIIDGIAINVDAVAYVSRISSEDYTAPNRHVVEVFFVGQAYGEKPALKFDFPDESEAEELFRILTK